MGYKETKYYQSNIFIYCTLLSTGREVTKETLKLVTNSVPEMPVLLVFRGANFSTLLASAITISPEKQFSYKYDWVTKSPYNILYTITQKFLTSLNQRWLKFPTRNAVVNSHDKLCKEKQQQLMTSKILLLVLFYYVTNIADVSSVSHHYILQTDCLVGIQLTMQHL